MKKTHRLILILIFSAAINLPNAKAQIILEQELLDSILSITVEYKQEFRPDNPVYPNYPTVIKLSKEKNSSNTIFASSTWIVIRTDIPDGSFIYLQNQKIHFLILDNISATSELQSKLITPESSFYRHIIDSIQMPYRPHNGIITQREKLVVYRIKRKALFRKYYVVTSQSFIPYKSAPIQFQPVINFSDENSTDKISFYYYGNRMRLKKEYYDDLKPIKPVKFRLSRKNN
jgi:hypothetical protein